ncbi:hypothetical protein MFU01_25500 [Myxococcus fulvus]|uniref:Uncharacterized protein n=1 Tax=Myxococcus fulvus TaxID=33 RepID=A0A511T1L8_MYXFU|nr:hypothetical protein MFU01_25500 [Myxococcus fulvus]
MRRLVSDSSRGNCFRRATNCARMLSREDHTSRGCRDNSDAELGPAGETDRERAGCPSKLVEAPPARNLT